MTAQTTEPQEPKPERVLSPGQTREFDQMVQGDPEQLADPGKKALLEERAARKKAEKAFADIQTQLDGINRANESALEKAQREQAEAVKQAQTATAEALRWRIAAKHGISDEDAETFLTGADEEALTRQAKRLASFSATPADTTTAPGPRPDLTQGGKAERASSDPSKDFANFLQKQLN